MNYLIGAELRSINLKRNKSILDTMTFVSQSIVPLLIKSIQIEENQRKDKC